MTERMAFIIWKVPSLASYIMNHRSKHARPQSLKALAAAYSPTQRPPLAFTHEDPASVDTYQINKTLAHLRG